MDDIARRIAAKEQRIDQSHRLVSGRTALLVVDMQHAFLDEGASLEVPAGREVIPNVARLIDACRAKNVPVIFTEFVYAAAVPCLRGNPFGPEHLPAEKGAATGFGLPSSNCLIGPAPGAGAESADTVAELAPRRGELVVRAHTYDKFYGTPLDLALRSQDVRYLLVTGVTTDVCVNSTIIAAAMRDYRVTAVTDGMAAPHRELHEACLTIWRNKFARLQTTEDSVMEVNSL